jgi:predicted nucleic acid-binding protein
VEVCRDPKDNKILALAFEHSSDFIVSGDNDLLILNPYKNIPILTPNGFLE